MIIPPPPQDDKTPMRSQSSLQGHVTKDDVLTLFALMGIGLLT